MNSREDEDVGRNVTHVIYDRKLVIIKLVISISNYLRQRSHLGYIV